MCTRRCSFQKINSTNIFFSIVILKIIRKLALNIDLNYKKRKVINLLKKKSFSSISWVSTLQVTNTEDMCIEFVLVTLAILVEIKVFLFNCNILVACDTSDSTDYICEKGVNFFF